MIVLDTNVLSEPGKPKPNPRVLAWFRCQPMAELYLCGPVIMEQSHGAERMLLRTGSDRYQLVLADMVSREFRGRILEFDGEAPLLAGKLRATRESRGRPLSIPDAMIAAICLLHGAALATRNVRDFEGLDLVLVNPFEAGA